MWGGSGVGNPTYALFTQDIGYLVLIFLCFSLCASAADFAGLLFFFLLKSFNFLSSLFSSSVRSLDGISDKALILSANSIPARPGDTERERDGIRMRVESRDIDV